MMKNRFLWLLMITGILLFAACGSGRVSDAESQDTTEEIEPLPWDMSLHYQLEDKYQFSPDIDELNDWKSQLTTQPVLYGKAPEAYNLFLHKGGGPGGAEWNSDAHLYLVIWGAPFTDVSVEVKLNGQVAKEEFDFNYGAKAGSFTLLIPYSEWDANLIDIAPQDYRFLYSKEDIKKSADQENTQLGVGKILKIEVTLTPPDPTQPPFRLEKAFHIAYGE